MTETVYTSPLQSFKSQDIKESWYEVDILGRGVEAMIEVNLKLGYILYIFLYLCLKNYFCSIYLIISLIMF